MKKLISIILCLVMLILAGCNAADTPNDNDTENPDGSGELVYTLYRDGVDAVSPSATGIQAARPIEEAKFVSGVGKATTPEKDESKTFMLTAENKEYVLEIRSIYTNGYSTSDIKSLKNVGNWKRYSDGTPKLDVDIFTETNKLRFFWKSPSLLEKVDMEFTKEKAIARAYDVIVSTYGKDVADEYSKHYIATGTTDGGWSIMFSRYIGEYMTDDDVSVTFSPYGAIECIRAIEMGTFDHLMDTVTEEQIKAAENYVLSLFEGKNVDLQADRLIANADGKCILEFRIAYNDITNEELAEIKYQQFFINVN